MNEECEKNRGNKHLEDIEEARRRAHHARRAARREKTATGDVSPETMAELGLALDDYQELLMTYRNADSLQDSWGDRLPIKNLDRLVTSTVNRSQRRNKATGSETESSFPQVVNVDERVLVEHGRELDQIYSELGFAAAVKDSRPIYHAGKRDSEDYQNPTNESIPKPE